MIFVDLVVGIFFEKCDWIICYEVGYFLVVYLLEIFISGYVLNVWEVFW